jgi:hypothetical protein
MGRKLPFPLREGYLTCHASLQARVSAKTQQPSFFTIRDRGMNNRYPQNYLILSAPWTGQSSFMFCRCWFRNSPRKKPIC